MPIVFNFNKAKNPRRENYNISSMSNKPEDSSERAQVAPLSLHHKLKRMRYDDYTVGWICALPTVELAPATQMLDEVHNRLPQNSDDRNAYTLGRIGGHNVVIACLSPSVTGTKSVATVVNDLSLTFPMINCALIVGIDCRLANTLSVANHRVVNHPQEARRWVSQHDIRQMGQVNRSAPMEPLIRAQDRLLDAINVVQIKQPVEEARYRLYDANTISAHPIVANARFAPVPEENQLLKEYHKYRSDQPMEAGCEIGWLLSLPERGDATSVIEDNMTTPTNQDVHPELIVNELQQKDSGLKAITATSRFACLVINGLYDHADPHDIGRWQSFAATRAAIYAKELLCIISTMEADPADVVDVMTHGEKCIGP